METLSERLAEMRRRRLMTQVDLALASGISAATVTRLETIGDTNPRVVTVKRLARALDVDPAWLLWGGEPALMSKKAA